MYTIFPKFFEKQVAPITLPEEYKKAVDRITDLINLDPDLGSEEEMEILMLVHRITAYEKSLFTTVYRH